MDLQWIEWGGTDYAAMLDLREEVLRRPLGLTLDRSALSAERESHLLTAWKDGEIIGCLVLSVEGHRARMRAVAVKDVVRKTGLGAKLVRELESQAQQLGCTEVYAHARANVLGFYERLGYTIEGDEFIEVTIPHRIVRKQLQSGT